MVWEVRITKLYKAATGFETRLFAHIGMQESPGDWREIRRLMPAKRREAIKDLSSIGECLPAANAIFAFWGPTTRSNPPAHIRGCGSC